MPNTTRRPLTCTILEGAPCEMPGCDHKDHEIMFLHAACHPGGGLAVSYHKALGHLALQCNTCDAFIANIGVAP